MRRGPPRCDVPGCGRERRRLHRLCGRCFGVLVRTDRGAAVARLIKFTRADGRLAEHRALCREAAELVAITPPATRPARVTPETAFAAIAATLGERIDP